MRSRAAVLAVAVLAVFAVGVQADGAGIRISDAWARALPPVAKNSSGYLRVENLTDKDDELIAVTVAGVRVTEMHEMLRGADGALSMRRRPTVAIPAQGMVSFAPGGLHLMLIDLQAPLRAGEQREAVLRFRDAGEVPVVLEVRPPGG